MVFIAKLIRTYNCAVIAGWSTRTAERLIWILQSTSGNPEQRLFRGATQAAGARLALERQPSYVPAGGCAR
jgi:hypothetical protein